MIAIACTSVPSRSSWKLLRRAMLVVFGLSMAVVSSAQAGELDEPTALAMVGDLVVARPAGLLITVVGTAAFIVSLPFTALGGNVGEAADHLVVGPAQATFVRCLGCTNTGRKSDIEK